MRVVALVGLVGCGLIEPSTPPGGAVVDPGLSFVTSSEVTNENGRLRVQVDVAPNTASFQVTGSAEQRVLYEQVIAPDGTTALNWEDWISSPNSITAAFFGANGVAALDWPVRDLDGPLVPGQWVVVLALVDSRFFYLPGQPVDVSTALKVDSDLALGRIGVQIVYAQGVDDDPVVVAGIEEAVERWRTVWSDIGIELAEHYESSQIDATLPFAFTSDASVENLAGRKAEGELQLIVGETIAADLNFFGVAAAIPGTIEVSPRTFVVLSWLSHAGTDGAFDTNETRLMGETMAHEIGHYTGLFHPVEQTYANYDALDDTIECDDFQTCDDELGRNLMYPYPLCDRASCSAQGQITEQQAAVVHQFVGAL